ncbi:MAG: beta-ketoacyl-ACP synthase II [Candidatus Promineifilaceae bacterium]|nr:beta-ketoacyl-ACP synthase II [Candidatus Promineifilaceae bacterium]
MQNERRVVITGIGTLNPLGNSVDSTWHKIANGESGIGLITHFDARDQKTQIAGEVKDFDPVALFGRKEARRLSRATQLALAAADQAIADAGFSNNNLDRDRIGTIIGSGMGSMDPIIDSTHTLSNRGPNRVSPFFVPMMLADTPAAVVSITYGLSGPNMSVATACATGNNVLGEAAVTIRRNAADLMIAGGTEACILPLAVAGFGIMKALSTRNDAPQEASRPFDKDRDGFVVSEGAAVLILEELEHALARNAPIYGELLGYGSSSDASHISQPDPDGAGAAKAIRAALQDAGLEAQDIDYINAHGTSTKMNDDAETLAIKNALGEYAYQIPVSSTKSMHGHLLGAAGTLEAIICLRAIHANQVPPTINHQVPDPGCDLDYVPNSARPANLQNVMSNGFGLGGHNASIILGRY